MLKENESIYAEFEGKFSFSEENQEPFLNFQLFLDSMYWFCQAYYDNKIFEKDTEESFVNRQDPKVKFIYLMNIFLDHSQVIEELKYFSKKFVPEKNSNARKDSKIFE